MFYTVSIVGSVVECSPATRAARVRFPDDADNSFVHLLKWFFWNNKLIEKISYQITSKLTQYIYIYIWISNRKSIFDSEHVIHDKWQCKLVRSQGNDSQISLNNDKKSPFAHVINIMVIEPLGIKVPMDSCAEIRREHF